MTARLWGPVARAGLDQASISVSFEFFPPKTEEMAESLWKAVRRLETLDPAFVSVTYGAGGSTRERTHGTVKRLVQDTRLKPAAHLTCVNATREDVDQVIRDYHAAGVRHVVALRGDPPEGIGERYTPFPGGYANSAELSVGIKTIAPDMEISVGVYPEKHPESESFEADIDLLRKKIDAGASRGITQFFFDIETFLRFRDRLAAAGVAIPICPGIMPVTNFKGLARMAGKCGATVPNWLGQLFDGLDDDPRTRQLVAASFAAEQCARLQEEGCDHFHFYTLNRADLVYAICHILGVRPAQTPGETERAAA